MNVSISELTDLQAEPENIRNICILGHVDHGKTTLTDSLIASNGLIHPKMAGKLRFLDSREDEQARCITMKSSSIALMYADQDAHSADESDAQPDRDDGRVSSAGVRAGAGLDEDEEQQPQQLEESAVWRRRKWVVNLIDSPGHVDFCSEVSSAVRLSDGAVVLVDAVEGVCIQTHAVLRQAYQEKLKLCLVINKIDRLILELAMSPEEAYERLKQIVVQVNGVMSAFYSERYLLEADAILGHTPEEGPADGARGEGEEDAGEVKGLGDEDDVFRPQDGNVVFASAIDGWGFRVSQFAEFYSAKLGCSAKALNKALWGDFFFQPKTKKFVGRKGAAAASGKLRPAFVQFALEPLWQVYAASGVSDIVQCSASGRSLAELAKGLKVVVGGRELGHADPRVGLQALLRAWLPLSRAVLATVVHHLPNPTQAVPTRMERLVSQAPLKEKPPPALDTNQAAVCCNSTSPEAEVVVFVSKMISVPVHSLPRGSEVRAEAVAAGASEVFLAFGRVFSGVLTPYLSVKVLSETFDPSVPEAGGWKEVQLGELFLMMGTGLELLEQVSAGNVLAISGLDTAVLKTATLSSTLAARPFTSMSFQSLPIVQVAVEPAQVGELGALVEGLRLLNQADAGVQVQVQANGEHILGAAGEVHLERCIKDLQERFAKIKLHVSPPLVAFKETVDIEETDQSNASKQFTIPPVAEVTTANGMCTIHAWAVGLPGPTARVLQDHAPLLRQTHVALLGQDGEGVGSEECCGLRERLQAASLLGEVQHPEGEDENHSVGTTQEEEKEAEEKGELHPLLRQVWAFGPQTCGPNVLLASKRGPLWFQPKVPEDEAEEKCPGITRGLGTPSASQRLGLCEEEAGVQGEERPRGEEVSGDPEVEALWSTIEAGVLTGFQLASSVGPLCEEPLWGVGLRVEATLHLPPEGLSPPAAASSSSSTSASAVSASLLGGQVISATREAARQAVLNAGARLVEAFYLCEASTRAEQLGSTYAVLGRRRARVIREGMQEGSGAFTVLAFLPAQDSFALADELRRETSGTTSVQLMLSHWERIPEDPFFVPTTEDEREEFGEEGGCLPHNLARRLVDQVRRRKGLLVEEKVVQVATKQRTLARKK